MLVIDGTVHGAGAAALSNATPSAAIDARNGMCAGSWPGSATASRRNESMTMMIRLGAGRASALPSLCGRAPSSPQPMPTAAKATSSTMARRTFKGRASVRIGASFLFTPKGYVFVAFK